jgi:hypothetical protein
MKVIEELPLKHKRQLRHTLVQGRDEKHYKIFTFQLYDTAPPAEFPNYEVNVQECEADGSYKVLVQPYLKRFFARGLALDAHQKLLDEFDEALKLEEPAKHAKH